MQKKVEQTEKVTSVVFMYGCLLLSRLILPGLAESRR